MCSVIEIKNNDEYYIRYHSPDSMVENSLPDKKEEKHSENGNVTDAIIKDRHGINSGGSDDGTHTTSGDSGHQRDILSNSPKSQTEDQLISELKTERNEDHVPYNFFKARNKDVDVTSDRGSSEESIIDGKERMNTNNPQTDPAKRKTKYHRSTNNKKSQNRRSASIEKVPITINSHIPASPERLISQQKTVTHDTGTQMENTFEETSTNRVVNNILLEANPTVSTSDNYGHTKPIGQDNEKENKQAKNDILPQRDDRNTDNDQKLQEQEANAHQKENPIIEKRNGISNIDATIATNTKYLLDPGMDTKSSVISQLKPPSNSKEGLKKKSFLCRSSANNKNNGASSSVLPIQLEEKNKSSSSSSLLKQSNIPILIKKEASPKRKLSSLMGNAGSKSSTNNDSKDKNVKKVIKKSKSNSDISLDANTNKSRKGSTKSNAKNEKKKIESSKKEGETTTTKISKISPIVALSNQCKNGFGKKKNKNPSDTNHEKETGDKPLSKTKNSSNDKKSDKNDKMVVKKSYSMDSIGDICKSNPKNDPGLLSKALYQTEHSFHHSQSQIDHYPHHSSDQQTFFEQHPHAVLKAAKTKDGYTVYGSGKKWTLDSGKSKKTISEYVVHKIIFQIIFS